MKKIYCHAIKMGQSYNEGTGEPIYDNDPIKDYVENAIENVSDGTFWDEGYSWDEGKNISFFPAIQTNIYHVLYRNGEPIELYYVK